MDSVVPALKIQYMITNHKYVLKPLLKLKLNQYMFPNAQNMAHIIKIEKSVNVQLIDLMIMDSNVFLAIFLNIGIMNPEDVKLVQSTNTIVLIKKHVLDVLKDLN